MNFYRVEDQIGFLLRIVQQRYVTLFSQGMIEGITPPQFAALAKLREVGPCSQARLGTLLHLDPATIKGVVDRLIGRGFVIIADNPGDRRRRAIGLTERGMSVTDEAIKAAGEISDSMLSPLEESEQRQIRALLNKLLTAA